MKIEQQNEVMQKLDALIPRYALNKEQSDELKKVLDNQNREIKELMYSAKFEQYESDTYKATCSVSLRESFNEEKLLSVISKSSVAKECVKTKEYVDIEALENALYHNHIDEETLLALDSCKEVKEIVTLRVTKKKGKRK